MRKTFLLLAIALLIATPAPTSAQNAPLKSLMPLRVKNAGWGSLTVKVVGPTRRTLRLGSGENLVVIVTPGEYQCFYRFKGGPRDPFTFKKTEKFQVSAPAPNKPNDAFEVEATEEDRPRGVFPGRVEDVVASSLKEFNAADANAVAPDGIDSLRFSNLNLVLVIGELSYGDTPEDKRVQKKLVTARLNEYIRGALIPKLSRQGFKVKYLGVREEIGDEILREPTLEIDYGETEGPGYTMYSGYGQPSVFGVVIDCTLLLVHPAILAEQGIWDASLKAENDESLKINILADQGAVLHNQALRYLRMQLNDLEFDLADWAPKKPAGARPRVRKV